jgi:hypothetical protein
MLVVGLGNPASMSHSRDVVSSGEREPPSIRRSADQADAIPLALR